MPTGDGNDGNTLGVVSDLLDVCADFLGDFLESGLAIRWFGVVDLVDANYELFYT